MKVTLQHAQRLIAENLLPRPPETVELSGSLNRITAADITAAQPMPTFAESVRDGYALASGDHGNGAGIFTVVGEIAAGSVLQRTALAPGTACRIMTGGWVPEGSARVVPYERCTEKDGRLTVPGHLLQTPESYIRQAGSEVAQGERLVKGGVRLMGEHLELLSSCGIHAATVSALPAVGYFCTGSELQPAAAGLAKGRKFSSNAFLLAGILPAYGATLTDFGICGDNLRDLSALLARAGEWDGDVLVSTGGMGPGKYDLVEKAFLDAGGVIFFNGLAMRPGKAMLVGRLGRALFFALPGPPPAVRTLLHTLVGPALLAMQGGEEAGRKNIQAYLLSPLTVKHHEVLHLREGVLILADGRCLVRPAARLEVANCHILLQPGCSRYGEGESVEVRLIGQPVLAA